MSKLRLPYQCLKQCGTFLVAARGSSIDTFNIKDGSYISTWKYPVPENLEASKQSEVELKSESIEEKPSETSSPDIILEASTPPAKRRKLSTSEEAGKPEETEKKIVVQQGKKKEKAPPKPVEPSAISILTVTRDQQHVIAVTGEDKTIRVMKCEDDAGKGLKQISDRCMPKRPCALATTADDSTIICADKFGDVYSLPLIPAPQPEAVVEDVPSSTEKQNPKQYQPAASNLTVHSARNLKALEYQKRHSNQASEKTGPSFEHKLLLGHVSMLTDIATATANDRHYILTADRDEHIRISRGIPQTHIIEGFCLGHEEYISRLCIPGDRPDLLISGGGDDYLCVWDWVNGQLLSKVDLKSHVEGIISSIDAGPKENVSETEPRKIAVNGIYHASNQESGKSTIIVTSEGIPSLFIYTLNSSNQLQHSQTLPLPGNALSIVSTSNLLIVSIDNIHKPGSTTIVRDNISETVESLQFFTYENGEFVSKQRGGDEFVTRDTEGFVDEEKLDRLRGLLYAVGNLRKMEGDEE